jgi:hypothetical protein
MNPLSFLKGFASEYVTGLKTADRVQREMIKARDEVLSQGSLGYGQSVLDPRFAKDIKKQGISVKESPAQAAGAYTSRALVDAANDGTRTYWWRWNHPLAIAQRVVETGVGKIESPTAKALTGLAIAVPAVAAAGTYDITNPEEQFRPEGYAQTYSPKGAEDRRTTGQPVQELFERFFLGRTGEPLKYATAKEEIPDLTPERYGNYLNFLYNDKGLLGLGVIKGTMENLQGNPEVRMLGFPVNLPMVGGFVTGTAGAKVAASTGSTPRQRAVRGIAGGAIGSLLGIATGNAANEIIASNRRNQLPTTAEYGVTTGKI